MHEIAPTIKADKIHNTGYMLSIQGKREKKEIEKNQLGNGVYRAVLRDVRQQW